MAQKLEVFTDREKLTAHITEAGRRKFDNAVLCELGGGVLRFAEVVFPGADADRIYAQPNEREPEGRGAHFDVYDPYVDEEFRWIGIYNLAGKAAVRTSILASELADIYFRTFPEPDDTAFEVRRHFAAISLVTPGVKIYEGKMDAGTGLVLPQKTEGPHIIHDIIPAESEDPGKFIKMVVPSGQEEAMKKMSGGGYEPLDQLISEGLGTLPSPQGHAEVPLDLNKRLHRAPRPQREEYRRDCNLD